MEEVLGETVGVGQKFGEVVLAGVVELLLRGAAEHFIDDGGVLAFELFLLFEDFGFGGFENAVEAAEDGHREHDLAVFGRAVGSAEEVGNVPDETYQAVGVIGQGRAVLFVGKRMNCESMSLSEGGEYLLGYGGGWCSGHFLPARGACGRFEERDVGVPRRPGGPPHL